MHIKQKYLLNILLFCVKFNELSFNVIFHFKRNIIFQFCHLSNCNENSATQTDIFLSSFMGKMKIDN